MAYLKPAPGLVVRDPTTLRPLPPEGAEVPLNAHWRRRLKDGDVVVAAKPKTQPKPKES